MVSVRFNAICAIGIFLFAVYEMSESLKGACGKYAGGILKSVCESRFLGLLVGFLLTGIIQSSAAVTVAATALIEQGALSSVGACSVIIGSNIGTTVTSVIIALELSPLAPIFVFAGSMLLLLFKNERLKSVGIFLCSLALLFIAVEALKFSATELNRNGLLTELFLKCENPLASVLVGTAVTALMQSSSATVGILQTLVSVGIVKRSSAVFIICGQNIGAAAPTLLSSIKMNNASKTAALFHLLFNILGTALVFLISIIKNPAEFLTNIEDGSAFVSTFHVCFNLVSTAVLYPFTGKLVHFSQMIINRRMKLRVEKIKVN